MAERYYDRDDRERMGRGDDRSGSQDWRRSDSWRDDDRPRGEERGFTERAGDEVRSWFGDDEAARRREMDDRRHERERGREWRGHEWRNEGQRGEGPRWRDDFENRGEHADYGSRGSGWSGGGAYGASSGYGGGNSTAGGSRDWSTSSSGSGRTPDYSYGQSFRGSSRGQFAGSFGQSTSGWQHGRFTGRGPKGYQRSDDRIREEVCDLLTQHGEIDASDLEIEVSGGDVTLKGTVDARDAKRAAEDVAESVQGVRQVHNQIRVTPHEQQDSMNTAMHASLGGAAQANANAAENQRERGSGPSRTR